MQVPRVFLEFFKSVQKFVAIQKAWNEGAEKLGESFVARSCVCPKVAHFGRRLELPTAFQDIVQLRHKMRFLLADVLALQLVRDFVQHLPRSLHLVFPHWLPLARVAAEIACHLFHGTLGDDAEPPAARSIA